jgi:hypothetical protein
MGRPNLTARRLAILALAASLTLTLWIYARDRFDSPMRLTDREEAQLDADEILNVLEPSRGCPTACRADLLGRTASRTWRVRLQLHDWQDCFLVSLDGFAETNDAGVQGLRAYPCTDNR